MSIFSINEVYFGKNKEIQELFDLFKIFRNDAINQPIFKSINNIPSRMNFNRKVEEVFGFKTFSLEVKKSNSYNAYTIPISMNFDVWNTNKNLMATRNGFKYKPDAKYSCCVCIFSGLLTSKNFTDEECFAIILHEIGHNFSNSLDKNMFGVNVAKKLLLLVENIINLILYQIIDLTPLQLSNFLNNIDNNIEKKLFDKKIYKVVNDIKFVIEGYIDFIKSIIEIIKISNPVYNIISLITVLIGSGAILIKGFLGYNDEKISDNFVTMYGFGKDLSSGLSKMDKGVSKDNMFYIFELYKEIMTLPLIILFIPLDQHPTNAKRMQNQIKYIQKELDSDNDMDSKMKKEMQEQIKEINKILEKSFEINKKGDTKKVQKIYEKMIYNSYINKGGLIKDKITQNNYDKIQNAYDDKINQIVLK